jgi:polysaccharide biosynthesis protein PslH
MGVSFFDFRVETRPPDRTLILGRMLYPPMGGVYLRNWQMINILRQFGTVAVFSLFEREIYPPTLSGVEDWTHFNLAADRSVRSRLEEVAQWFKQAGLTYYYPYRTTIAQALEQAIATFQPNLVFLEQLWMIPYLPVLQRHPCRIVYDAHNVEVPLYQATKCAGIGVRSHLRTMLHIPQIHASEKKLLHQADQVWVCSEADAVQLHQCYPVKATTAVIPNGLDLSVYKGLRPGLEQSESTILLLANFAHIPNAAAAQTLITDIYPSLKAIYPQCRLLLVGRHPTPAMQSAAQRDPAIVVTGEVEDINPFLAIASTMVVPLTEGSGTRLKILEAFAAQCPVVSTAKGAEGLAVQDGEHLLIREGHANIVQGVLQLWGDSALASRLTRSAFQLMQSQYSWEAVNGKVERALQRLWEHHDD